MRTLHPWDVSPQEAQAIQRRLAAEVSPRADRWEAPELVAGVDISPPDPRGVVRGAVTVWHLPQRAVVEVKTAQGNPPMPYIPGLLSFRESPVILRALERLRLEPQALLVDGHGLAHPRRFGIACHLGVLVDLPTIGCAKSILRGHYQGLGQGEGSWAPLMHEGGVVGAAVRTRSGIAPIFVSVGHKVDLETAIRWTLACCHGYRMPEPTRLAHQAAAGQLPEQEPTSPGPQQGQLW